MFLFSTVTSFQYAAVDIMCFTRVQVSLMFQDYFEINHMLSVYDKKKKKQLFEALLKLKPVFSIRLHYFNSDLN